MLLLKYSNSIDGPVTGLSFLKTLPTNKVGRVTSLGTSFKITLYYSIESSANVVHFGS